MAHDLTEATDLTNMVRRFAVIRGRFRLSSGLMADHFIDLSRVLFLSEGADLVARIVHHHLTDLSLTVLGGPSTGADRIVGATLSWVRNCRGFTIAKDGKINGLLRERDVVLLVEDVITTGTQTEKAIEIVRSRGASVRRVLALVDRQGGAAGRLRGQDYRCVLTSHDLGLPPVCPE